MSEVEEKKILVSFVMPAYKEAKSIRKSVLSRLAIISLIEKEHDINIELIVVNDGELDNSKEILLKMKDSRLKVISYPENLGKGFAVRLGMLEAKGDFVGFIDAGEDINLSVMQSLVAEKLLNPDIHIIVGSKKHPKSKLEYPLKRRIYSFGYSMYVRFLTGVRMNDTQVGAKLYSRELIDTVLPRILAKRYAFDIEILAVAKLLGYKKHIDVPVEIDFPRDESSVRILFSDNSVRAMMVETLAISYRLNILRYYNKKYQEEWERNMNGLTNGYMKSSAKALKNDD